MKNILLITIDALILVIMVICMVNGLHIGPLYVPSFQDIANYSQDLNSAISEANQKAQDYDGKLATIKKDIEKMTKAKKAYLDLLTISTDSEIQRALQTRTYYIEYLWEKVNLHASEEGVTVKMEITDSSLGDKKHKNLNFSVVGTYTALTNFISELENDSELEFTIDNFDMIRVQYGKNGQTKEECVFVVKDVSIVDEKTTVNSVNETTKLIEPQDLNKKEQTNTTDSNKTNKTNTTDNANSTSDKSKTNNTNNTNENNSTNNTSNENNTKNQIEKSETSDGKANNN